MASIAASKAPAPSAPLTRGKKLPWVLGAGALLLGGGGLVGYLQLGKPLPSHASGATEPSSVESDPGVTELEPFILNLADPAGDRYLRLEVSLVLDRKEIAARASAGLPQVKLRDRVLSVLAKKRAAELATSAGKERLREEILATVEPLLAEPPFFVPDADGQAAHILEILFTEFLLQ